MQPRVLVVEDDKIVLDIFEDLLSRHGYALDCVQTAEDALEFLGKTQYDLIISDIVLPGMDGLELLRHVKKDTPDIDVILMTAYAKMDSVLAAIDAGVYDYLTKPFENLEEIERKIERALEKRRILRENARLIEYLRQANSQIEGMNRDLEAKVSERTKQLEYANKRLEELSITDDVTGLYNQRYLHQRLNDEFLRSKRYDYGLAVVMIDLDKFKNVNDSHDHVFGSNVLNRVGKLFRDGVRSMDVVIRYGGDEFVLVLPHTQMDAAVFVAERLRNKLESEDIGDESTPYNITASFGVAAVGESEAADPLALLRAADKALYLAKATGRNRVAIMRGVQPLVMEQDATVACA